MATIQGMKPPRLPLLTIAYYLDGPHYLRANDLMEAVGSTRQKAIEANEDLEVLDELDVLVDDLALGMGIHESMRARGHDEMICTIIGYGVLTGEGLPSALRLASACADAVEAGTFEPAAFWS